METNRTLLNRRAGVGGRVRRRLVAVASAACAVLALAGCVEAGPVETTPPDAITAPPDTPTPTETSTPTPTPPSAAYFASPPQSVRQALEDVSAAYAQFLSFRANIYEGKLEPSFIDDIAAGPLRDNVYSSTQAIMNSGSTVEIDDKFEPDFESSFAIGTEYPNNGYNEFGSVTLFGCLDLSGRHGVDVNGIPLPSPENARFRTQVTALYEPDTQRWLIHTETNEVGGAAAPC